MTQQEQARLQVLNNLLAGYMTTEQAAILMGVSARHTRRILAAYREKGAAAIAHGNRGRSPANATPSTLAIEAVRLARTRYAGVNHTHLSELLREREGIDIGRDTLRRILTNAGVNSPRRRRPPKHRVRRQRMPREGMLIQVDGSYHRWLGKDGPQFTLLLAIDDATGIGSLSTPCSVSWRTPTATSRSSMDSGQGSCGTRRGNVPGQARYTTIDDARCWRASFHASTAASACRIQVHSTVGSCRCSNPVQSCDGRAWRTADIRSITSGQGFNAPRERSRTGSLRSCALRARPPSTMLDEGVRLDRVLCFKYRRTAPGTTRSDTAGTHFNCCPARTGRATPGQP